MPLTCSRADTRWPRGIVALLATALLMGAGLSYVMTQDQRPHLDRFGISDPELITKAGRGAGV